MQKRQFVILLCVSLLCGFLSLRPVYVLVGLLSGLAGFLLSARLSFAGAVAGEMFELRVIALAAV